MSETPSWLQAGNDAPPPASAPAPVGSMNLETSTAAGGTTTAATTTTASAADEKDLPSVILLMRLVNMGVAGALIAFSVSFAGNVKRNIMRLYEDDFLHITPPESLAPFL
jgi:hypothetical protein